MKQTDPQFKLRIPPSLKAQLDESSERNHRSINAEIVDRLERIFAVEQTITAHDAREAAPPPAELLKLELQQMRLQLERMEQLAAHLADTP